MKKVKAFFSNLFGSLSKNHGVALLVSLIMLALLVAVVLGVLHVAEQANVWIWNFIGSITERDVVCVGIGICICVVLDFIRFFKSHKEE